MDICSNMLIIKLVRCVVENVYIITKTHLDLGFTDLASNIVYQYINDYIPSAIELARVVNKEKKIFAWTTGSWIIHKALKEGTKEQVEKLTKALKNGDIIAHALPFTTHTELMDELTFRDGLDLIKKIDKITGRNTVAAKMTDVPGHTIAVVPILAEYGIKMLHIGVNEASAVPEVPDIFLWKHKGAEVVVVYNKSYGNEIAHPKLKSVAAFCHTSDNYGPINLKQALANYNYYAEKYPKANVVATGLDEIANELFEIRQELPVITSEIGDSWIHGSTTDPYKAAAQRELMRMKKEWLLSGAFDKESKEYEDFSDAVLTLAEHTNGGDVKRMFSDFTNYLKKDFEKARKNDLVVNSPETYEIENGIVQKIFEETKDTRDLKYSRIEKTWDERRLYIENAVFSLQGSRRIIARKAIDRLIPPDGPIMQKRRNLLEFRDIEKYAANVDRPLKLGEYKVVINKFGGISLYHNEQNILKAPKDSSILEYVAHSYEDVEEFFKTYNRPEAKDYPWAHGDFGRPGLSRWKEMFPSGRFNYYVKKITLGNDSILVSMDTKNDICENLGAPREVLVRFTTQGSIFKIQLIWLGKDANRLQEEINFRLYPSVKKTGVRVRKLGSYINPYDVIKSGNRNSSAVEHVLLKNDKDCFKITSHHCPLFSLGQGKIMKFDNKYENIEKDGFSFILYNNIWGTNFPLWYSDNAFFTFEIECGLGCRDKDFE